MELAALCDVMDGLLARWLHCTSEFGKQLDSLADIISFGLAPTFLILLYKLENVQWLGSVAAVAFLICGALRLARFNISAPSRGFVGMPITATGVILSMISLLDGRMKPEFILVLMGLLSVMMISRIPFPSFKKNINRRSELSMPWITELISQYGYLAIFALLALGILGLPVPDEALMLLVGYLSSVMVLDFSLSVLIGCIGSITGMIISYTIGLRLGQPVVNKYGKWIGLTPKRFARVKGWFSRFGIWTVLFAYFIPGVRHVASYISGISAMPFKKYVLVSITGALTWSLLFVSIGYFIGSRFSFA